MTARRVLPAQMLCPHSVRPWPVRPRAVADTLAFYRALCPGCGARLTIRQVGPGWQVVSGDKLRRPGDRHIVTAEVHLPS